MTAWPITVPPLPSATPNDRPVALLLRHGERPPITAGSHGADLALTEAGRHTAEALGAVLGRRILGLRCSPVRRCRETAEALRRGADRYLDIVDDRLLGDPGVFVDDAALAWTHWVSLGHEAVVEHLARTEGHPLPGLTSPARASRRLWVHLAGTLDGSVPGLQIFITHDAVLYPALVRGLCLPRDRETWPNFLEAAALWHDEANNPMLAYRDEAQPLHNGGLST